MRNGLYSAEFGTPLGAGTGIVVAQDGLVRGGDSMMMYRGAYRVEGGELTGEIRVDKHSNMPGMQSVFGLDLINIKVKGKVSGDYVDLTGSAAEAPGVPFKARLKRLSD
jgi:hypothetical protein